MQKQYNNKYQRLELIPWWNKSIIKKAKVLVIGAGALGNEVLKNLSLIGIKNIFIVDFDKIEVSNLTRSILFNEGDVNKYKAQVAAKRIKKINPDVNAFYFFNDIKNLGYNVYKQMDVVISCVDNREARIIINEGCYYAGKVWLDGAIEIFHGNVNLFNPKDENLPCYECLLTDTDYKILNKRYSCLKPNKNTNKIATFPSISSIIGGILTQEAIKFLHNMEIPVGKSIIFDGQNYEVYLISYKKKKDCLTCSAQNQNIPQNSIELKDSKTITLLDIYNKAKDILKDEVIIELDRDIVLNWECSSDNCRASKTTVKKELRLWDGELFCPKCHSPSIKLNLIHRIEGSEYFLNKTLSSFNFPKNHIIWAYTKKYNKALLIKIKDKLKEIFKEA